MANETIKAFLMLALFGALEAALYLPRIKKPVHVWVRLDWRKRQ
jgi:hypothetical protein